MKTTEFMISWNLETVSIFKYPILICFLSMLIGCATNESPLSQIKRTDGDSPLHSAVRQDTPYKVQSLIGTSTNINSIDIVPISVEIPFLRSR